MIPSALSETGVAAFSLRSRRRQMLFLLGIGVAALLLASQVVRIAVAAKWGESLNSRSLQKAIALDPANPEYYYRLGLVYSYSLGEVNLPEAARLLRKSTDLNPHKALYWSALASACDSMNDTTCADRALERVLSLSPMTPRLHWIAANHYVLTNRPEIALSHFQRLLQLDWGYARSTFRICLRLVDDPVVIFDKVLASGNDPDLKLRYLDFLSGEGKTDAADRVWAEVVAARPSPFAFSLVQTYLDRLLNPGQVQQAVKVWQDLEHLGVIRRPAAEDQDNLVFNGGFEQVPLNAGLDWRCREFPYVSVDFAAAGVGPRSRSLRIDFTVRRNGAYEPVYQFVPVTPNRVYVLTAQVRSEQIASDSGPRLRVLDPFCPTCPESSSEMTVGTTPWHPVSLRFATGPQTQLIQLSLWRPRSRTFPTEISGTFWVDGVSLKALPTATAENATKPRART
jgi:tetratricopeptide (TPR) repeat protein